MNRAIYQKITKLAQWKDTHLLNQYLMPMCQALFGVQNTVLNTLSYFLTDNFIAAKVKQ